MRVKLGRGGRRNRARKRRVAARNRAALEFLLDGDPGSVRRAIYRRLVTPKSDLFETSAYGFNPILGGTESNRKAIVALAMKAVTSATEKLLSATARLPCAFAVGTAAFDAMRRRTAETPEQSGPGCITVEIRLAPELEPGAIVPLYREDDLTHV